MKVLQNQKVSQNRGLTKINLKAKNLKEVIDFFNASYDSYELRKTGYTAEIIVNTEEQQKKYFFCSELMNNRAFIAYNMVKRDVQASEIIIDEIQREKIPYYKFNNIPENIKECSCVDITAAYPNTLKNAGLITPETFAYLMSLPKIDRLKSVGMLATRKAFYSVNSQKVTQIIINENETAKYFYAICQIVGEFMLKLFAEFQEHVYLFWVDGIFCSNLVKDEIYKRICEFYPAKIEQIQNLRNSKTGNYVIYEKEGKTKFLPIPKQKQIHEDQILKWFNF